MGFSIPKITYSAMTQDIAFLIKIIDFNQEIVLGIKLLIGRRNDREAYKVHSECVFGIVTSLTRLASLLL